jgi:Zn-dependent protease with chaperone function/type II secretory pathway pseudopilin PulG
MQDLVYRHERTLGLITLVLGIIAWLLIIVGTVGVALIALLVGFVAYLFAQSTLISHIKGNGVELTEAQFPDLYAQFAACCDRLEIKTRPKVYILNGDGGFNAFATKFIGTQYVVLLSGIVDALRDHEDGVRFYIGHELGHLRMKHLSGHFFRWPVLWLPLLGAAYSRARESTCDRHGRACCASSENAARAMSVLSAGAERWKKLDLTAYQQQVRDCGGFWMSFHELTGAYPWLSKRVARIMGNEGSIPRRNPFAYVISVFVPFAGRLGGGFGLLIMVYIVGMLAAIAIPAYQDYVVKAKVAQTVSETAIVRETLGNYYQENQQIPESLEAIGMPTDLPDGTHLTLDQDGMLLTATMPKGEVIFVPSQDESGHITWICQDGEGITPAQLPATCRDTP